MRFVECVRVSQYDASTEQVFLDLDQIAYMTIGDNYAAVYFAMPDRWVLVTPKDGKRIAEELRIIGAVKP